MIDHFTTFRSKGLKLLLFTDSFLTETAVYYLIPEFNRTISICKISYFIKCSKKQFWKFLLVEGVHSWKIYTMIINSSGGLAKVSLSADIRLCNTSWKLVEDVLARPIILEWYVKKTSWIFLEGTLKTSSRYLEDVLKTC